MPTLALLSDIHANLPALEAVTRELDVRRPDAVFVLGDMINGCAWPEQVLELIQSRGWQMLLGNHDDAVLQLGRPRMEARYAHRERYATLWWTRERITDRQVAALTALPLELSLAWSGAPALRLVHGIPGSFFLGFRPDAPAEWVAAKLAGVGEATLVGGHTHAAMVRQVGRWLVVNSGSVGMPFDGDTRAGYAWLESRSDHWQAEICRVAYDLGVVDAGFARSGLNAQGGAMAAMVRRSVLSGLPWLADFNWWVREQPSAVLEDMQAALELYDSGHGPGRWAFPYV